MSFSPAWLALRAHADTRARVQSLESLTRDALAQRARGTLIDLGSGSGANCRYLAPRLGDARPWLLVDNDAVLLRQAEASCRPLPGVTQLQTLQLDLAERLPDLPLSGAALLTASALLDLVSLPWLTALVDACHTAALPALFTLSYDGRISLSPADPDDEWLITAINTHQRGDKGFGPALGPQASEEAVRLFSAAGYEVTRARSDWQLDARDPADAALLQPLIEGWAGAAAEQYPDATERAASWCRRRLHALSLGQCQVTVGHEDVLALPSGTARRSQS